MLVVNQPAAAQSAPGAWYASYSPASETVDDDEHLRSISRAPDAYPLDEPSLEPYQPAYMAPMHEQWTLQCMPDGLIYHSYMAGVKEPRLASVWSSEKNLGSVWDAVLGGRLGILRYGTTDNGRPDGWQVDLAGAVFARLDPKGESTPLIATDYRAGIPVTYGYGPLHVKLEYYHISSHLGDEYMLMTEDFDRINYSRDTMALGIGFYCTDALRVYGEMGYAPSAVGGAEPWDFQGGIDYSPAHTGRRGTPFAALNAHSREDVDFDGNFVAQVGWQWRQGANGRAVRLGLQYFTGKSEQYEFFTQSESRLGYGMWVDF